MADLIEMQMVPVEIKRDQNVVISTEVLPSEIPVLQAMHMPENVKVLEGVEGGVVEVDPSAESEYARLLSKYDRKEMEVVRRVFLKGPADLSEFGFKVSGAKAAVAPQASVKVRPPVGKKAAAKK